MWALKIPHHFKTTWKSHFSIDESPAHISNKLAQARQRRFYPAHPPKCMSGHSPEHLPNLIKGKKRHVCVCFETADAHKQVWGSSLHPCELQLWFVCRDSPLQRELWGPMGTGNAESLPSRDLQPACSFWLGKNLLSSVGTPIKKLL